MKVWAQRLAGQLIYSVRLPRGATPWEKIVVAWIAKSYNLRSQNYYTQMFKKIVLQFWLMNRISHFSQHLTECFLYNEIRMFLYFDPLELVKFQCCKDFWDNSLLSDGISFFNYKCYFSFGKSDTIKKMGHMSAILKIVKLHKIPGIKILHFDLKCKCHGSQISCCSNVSINKLHNNTQQKSYSISHLLGTVTTW